MIVYILKTICCSAFFIGIYYVLLEKAKMPHFNRIYLLLSLVASFIIPLIPFTTEVPMFPVLENLTLINESEIPDKVVAVAPSEKIDLVSTITYSIYFIISAFLLLRFIINIIRILSLARKHPQERHNHAKIVLLNKQVIPFSFLRYIFINKSDYHSGLIEPEVMHHEYEHIRKLHSLDIVFIELHNTIAWFNPFLLLYGKAIRLNHEFLADEAVVSRFQDPYSYQLLLLRKSQQAGSSFPVSSSLSYKITKKRLVRITNYSNRNLNFVRCAAIIPSFALALFLFSEKLIAHVPPASDPSLEKSNTLPVSINQVETIGTSDTTPKPPGAFPFIDGTKEGASPQLMGEYAALSEKYAGLDENGQDKIRNVTPADKARMLKIFSTMNTEQQTRQRIVFLKPRLPLTKATPSEALMKLFLDETRYGIWIDYKRVPNNELLKYKNTDFSLATVTPLYGKAKEGKSYSRQVNLTTNEFFEQNNARIRANKEPQMALSARNAKK